MKKLLLFVALCLFGLTSQLNAQTSAEVVIGSGDNYIHAESPINLFYAYSFSQMIYTADEINQSSGFISSVSFRMHQSYCVRNLSVYLQNTDKESFTNDRDYVQVSSGDLVFDGDVNLSELVNGWFTIKLNEPFKYDGGNLLVCLDDNTGDYEDEIYFYHYPASEDIRRTISSYTDYFDLTWENAENGDYSFNPTSKGYYINPQIRFDMIIGDELPVIAVKPNALDFGYCASGAWTPSQKVSISAMQDIVSITSISNENQYFEITPVETPYNLINGQPLDIEVKTGEGEGEITDVITIAYNDTDIKVELKAYAYEPTANDVFELATTIEEFPFSVTPELDNIYSNYELPGSAEKGKDIVYKVVLENGTIIKASVEGENGKVVLYPADFNGKEGPMVDNYFSSTSFGVGSNSFEDMIPAGEYYLIASATGAFTLNVETEAMPLPGKASLYSPWNNDVDVQAPVFFSWYLGDNTTEYQVLLGTTNPPTDILIDWTNDTETSYFLEEIAPATVYYWQIKSRNSSGVTESDINTFTTRLAIPSNVKIQPENIYLGEDITVSWDAVDGDILGYNVYLNDVKMNETVVTGTSFTFENLAYNAEGYRVNVRTVYETLESFNSPTIKFYVCAETEVFVSVFEQDGTTPIENTIITLSGTDDAGNQQVYTLPSDNGYKCKIYTGTYVAKAEKEGYQISEKEFIANYGVTNDVSITLNEVYYPVRWIKAEEKETSVAVSWDIEALPTDFEDFELGSLTAREWSNDSEYPWVITSNAYEGEYAMKSTGEKVDGAKSSIEISIKNEEDGLLSFYQKISSEKDADFGKFYIDGELMSTISGDVDWKYEEFYVAAGEHIYKWEYEKSASSNIGLDAYFVDNITFCKVIESENNVWIKYDNDEYVTSVGTGTISPLYWGIKVPDTYMYSGFDLTKVAIFDNETAKYTANIYIGGEDAPETLVSTQEFTTTGSKEIFEVNLTTPVTIDPTKPLWITMYCNELTYPATACISQNNPNSDFISLDGNVWEHATDYSLPYSWILRGYVEYSENSQKRSESRAFVSKYNVYKRNIFTQEETLLIENTTEKTFTDATWADVEIGAYQWGASALYEGNRDDNSNNASESEIVWSNIIGKNMSTKVTVNATTDTGDPIEGTKVIFKNLYEEKYSYTTSLDEKGSCVIEDFRKGEYELTVSLEGFESTYFLTKISVWNEETFSCQLREILAPANNLYVSPTAWVMWENGSTSNKGDEFFFDFEDGTLNGWVTIDADGDKYVWENFKEQFADEASNLGHNNSEGGVTSKSYDNYAGPLTPDNYLITEKKYRIGENSRLIFYVAGIDDRYQEEHYGVAISTKSNTSADDFVTIFEETLPANSKSSISRSTETKGSRSSRGYGKYFERIVDLSAYAGQSIYIALRHFNITDMYAICADDITLVDDAQFNRAFKSFEIYLNDELVAKDLTETHYQLENLVNGQEYTTTIIPVYTKGKGEATSYTWTYVQCDEFEGVKDLKAELVNDETIITWTLPETEVIGVNIYRNGELISEFTQGEEYIDKKATKDDEISVVAVHGGEKDVTYYAMSCPQTTKVIYNVPCVAPKNLHAFNTINNDGTFGATLVWPYTEVESGWLHYDDGKLMDGIGGPEHFYWGIMLPVSKLEDYAGASLTKVSLYNYLESSVNEGKIHIYYGGSNAPEVLVHSQNFSTAEVNQFVEFDLTYPLPVSGEENIWVVIESNLGTSFPAAASEDCGDPNARWISVDGSAWEDIAESGLNLSWMIRAYVSTNNRGTVEIDDNIGRAPSLKNYIIYRGTSLDDIEEIAETTNRRYFDEVEAGKYYYQVKAVYEEYGETCVSDAANSYFDPELDYVIVEVSEINENGVIGLMIYPNPTKGSLNINVESMKRITIANALGQIVYDQDVDSDNEIIDMAQYETGIYMIRIVTDKGVAVERISVVR